VIATLNFLGMMGRSGLVPLTAQRITQRAEGKHLAGSLRQSRYLALEKQK